MISRCVGCGMGEWIDIEIEGQTHIEGVCRRCRDIVRKVAKKKPDVVKELMGEL